MAFFKNVFFTTVFTVAICLSLMMGMLSYLQHTMLQQHIDDQQQSARLLFNTLVTDNNLQNLSSRLTGKLELLPGWQVATYDSQGQRHWQSGNAHAPVINIQQVNELALQGVMSVQALGGEEWLTRYYAVNQDNMQSPERFVAFSAPLSPLNVKVQRVTNLLLGATVIIGILLWFVTRLYTQSLKAEIRSYIRHHRKELTHDKLTGLRNREILLDRIEHGLEQAKRNQSLVAVLYIGLDRFKEINANLGHAAGDQLLRCYASRLSSVSRASDTLVRVEGDEFALLITGIKNTEELEHIANRIVKIFRTPVDLSGKQYSVSASIGIALDEQYTVNNETLVLNAYAAMKEVKKQGGGNIYQFFVKGMKQEPVKQVSKEAELYKALDNEEFRLYYQPQVDMASGAIKGMEAILRWQHPHRGLVSPNEFIPFLEETGLIITVGEWVLREACRVSKLWQDEGLPAIKVSINVSPVQLRQQDFAELVREVLASSGLDPARLVLEMTESCLMVDDDHIVNLLNELKKLGVSISVDNFGTGYTSLTRLKHFPVDMLKIDRSFITNLNDRSENDNADIVTAIMALSHSLQLDVVAKGVETQDELEYLNALGCCTIQGFLYSQPVSEYEFKSLLRASAVSEEKPEVQQALSH